MEIPFDVWLKNDWNIFAGRQTGCGSKRKKSLDFTEKGNLRFTSSIVLSFLTWL